MIVKGGLMIFVAMETRSNVLCSAIKFHFVVPFSCLY